MCLAPLHFRRRITRLVSYYALFKWWLLLSSVSNAEPFKDLGITDENGWIVTDEHMETKIAGIYAVGDVRQKFLRQITTAVGDAGIAGQEVFNYLQMKK